MKPIKLLSLFSGIGAFEKALDRLKIPYELVNYCEIDPYPAKAYSIIHQIPEEKNLWDVKKIHVDRLEDFDLLTWGFPCFEKGVLVMTDKGYKPIEEIQAGDKVLTHTNTFQSVVKPMRNYCDDLYEVQIFGTEKFKVTEEHPFYVREKDKKWDKESKKYIRQFSEPKWVSTKELNKKHYVGVAINQKAELPNWEGYTFIQHGTEIRKNELDFSNPDLWWLIGRYMGDGWTRVSNRKTRPNSPNYRTIICCGKNEKEKQEIMEKLVTLFPYTISKEKTTYKFHIVNKELTLYLMQFGNRAYNKHVTSDILNLPVNLLQSFLKGYFSADGCFTKNVYKASTVSQELAYGIQACIHKAFRVPCQLYSYYRKNESIIEGRILKERKHYELVFSFQTKGKEAFYEDGYIWVPFRKKEMILYHDYVYNMEVENDNSYTVYNLVVHNCTDVSVAGKAEGLKIKCETCHQIFDLSEIINMACPYCQSHNITSSTRSGLYFEGLKVLLAKKPKYSIIENVKGLTNKKNQKNFQQILKDLEDAGYNNYWKVLNAKDYGVPQNRERVFIVSIRKDIKQDFEFPEGFDSGIRLKHILEPVVDEKYYIPQDRCEKLLAELKEKIKVSPNNIIQLTNPSFSQQRVYSPEGNAPTLAAGNNGGGKEPCKIIELTKNENSNLNPVKLFDIPKEILNDNERQRRVYSPDGVSPTILARNDNAKILQVGKLNMRGSEQVRRVYNPEGLSPTLDTMQGGHRQPKIITYDINTKVYVRKYDMDTEKLKQALREAKRKSRLTNKEIAESLKKPLTMVEHWFRTDNSFSIPTPDIWSELKQLLQIETNEFDKPITVFEERDGVYEKSNRIYDMEGIAPTLTSSTPNEKILTKEPIKPNELDFLGGIKTGKMWLEDGNMYSRNFKQGNRVYSSEGIACSQTANGGGLGGATGLYAVYDPYNRSLPKDQEASTTLRTNYSNGNAQVICVENCQLRIRKLTPLECFLLMGFDKEDYKKLRENGFSDTRLYKMAGNSIVVNVLEHIFMQLFIKK